MITELVEDVKCLFRVLEVGLGKVGSASLACS